MKNRIMFITASLSDGGSERVMSVLANSANTSNDVAMVLVRDKKRTYKVDSGITVIQLNNHYKKAKLFIRRLIDLRSVIKSFKPDTVIAFMEDIGFFTVTACIGLKTNVILSIRNDPKRKDKRHFYWLSRLYNNRLADKIVFQTEQQLKCYPKSIQRKGYIIPNPIDSQVPPVFNGIRRKCIVGVGRLVPQKKFDLLIKTYAEIKRIFPDYILEIYGEGPERKKLETIIDRYHLDGSVSLKGFDDDVINKIKNASIYVSCSEFEGISNTMLEAMAMGIPTICTDCPIGGASMVIKNEVNGLLIPVDDANALVYAIKRIAENDEFAMKLSKNATDVRQQYSLEKVWKMWGQII